MTPTRAPSDSEQGGSNIGDWIGAAVILVVVGGFWLACWIWGGSV